jgi:hypothetical protein
MTTYLYMAPATITISVEAGSPEEARKNLERIVSDMDTADVIGSKYAHCVGISASSNECELTDIYDIPS